MEAPVLDVDSNCDSLVESIHPYSNYMRPDGGVMFNLFKPGSSFNIGLLDSDSCSSSDPIRADCSLNDGVAPGGGSLCSPKEDFFPAKRTSIRIQIEDDEICQLNTFPAHNGSLNESPAFHNNSVQGYAPHIPELRESYCGVGLLIDSNLPDDGEIHFNNPLAHLDKDHSGLYCATDASKVNPCAHEDYKQSLLGVSDSKPSLPSFITMENSNNAIDNNLHASISVSQSTPSSAAICTSNNHIFKLPNNELTFNGTLKHLQKLQSTEDFKEMRDDFDYMPTQEYVDKEESTESIQYKSSDELTSNSSASSSKSRSTMFSSASRFPSDCDIVSSDCPSKNISHKFSDVLSGDKTASECSKAFTFAGAVNPMVAKSAEQEVGMPVHLSHNKSGESMDSSYNSGLQSPNLFSDDEDDFNDQKCEAEKADLILRQFEKCDKLLINSLERTLQGVLPPPSVTICQLTAVEILERYQKYLPKFENPQREIPDSEVTASMTPPRRVSSDASCDPLLSSTLASALETTQMFDQSAMDQGSEIPCGDAARSRGFLHLNGSDDIATNEDWPQILLHRYHGVHYNSTPHSEHIDLLLSRYSSRYMGCETASSCVCVAPSTSGGRRSQPGLGLGAGGPSPGRRLSHLARRRSAFCTAASIGAAQRTTRRQILIDRKKFGNNLVAGRSQLKGKSPRTRRTPAKKTPGRKTPGKKTPGKKTPSSAQKKFAAKRLGISTELRMKSQPTRETSKRALFLSPENLAKPIDSFSSVSRPSTSRAVRSKRALFGSPAKSESSPNVTMSDSKAAPSFSRIGSFSVDNVSRKRSRLDDSISEDVDMTPKLQRSLTFGGDKVSCSERVGTLTRRATEYASSGSELTENHKKKLLWAVAEALRAHGIGMSHESFKQHATSLVRLTRKLCTLPVHLRALKTPFSSTSDTLLKIARLHVFAVIKGRSVEELFMEEQVKQLNATSSKVTGYIPPSGYEPSKVHTSTALSKNSENSYGEVKIFKPDSGSNKKTVLQDKTVNIEAKSGGKIAPTNPDLKKPVYKDNNKLRARRQISFDNMDDASSR